MGWRIANKTVKNSSITIVACWLFFRIRNYGFTQNCSKPKWCNKKLIMETSKPFKYNNRSWQQRQANWTLAGRDLATVQAFVLCRHSMKTPANNKCTLTKCKKYRIYCAKKISGKLSNGRSAQSSKSTSASRKKKLKKKEENNFVAASLLNRWPEDLSVSPSNDFLKIM